MEFELPAQKSQEIRVGTGQVLRATCITLCAAVAAVALSIGAFRLGFESARADIYERQAAKNEAHQAGLMALVGVVDQAKAREVASCAETGRSDCLAIVGGAL